MIGGVLVNFFGKNGLLSFPFFFDETLQFFSNTSINTQTTTEDCQTRSHTLFLALTVVRTAVHCALVVEMIRADGQLTACHTDASEEPNEGIIPRAFGLKCPKPVDENAGEEIIHHCFSIWLW